MNQSEMLACILRAGGSVCLTGEMQCADRITSMEIFEALGFMVSGSVSRKTRFLIAANGAIQTKIDRAVELNVPVVSEKEFWDAVDLVYPPATEN